MEKEAKKEAFRKYLESSGVLDALTKVLVALYEENDKPTSAVEEGLLALNFCDNIKSDEHPKRSRFVQQKLGGPSISDYEKLQAEKSDLQLMYDELSTSYKEKCKEIEELKNSKVVIDAFIDRIEDKGMD